MMVVLVSGKVLHDMAEVSKCETFCRLSDEKRCRLNEVRNNSFFIDENMFRIWIVGIGKNSLF